MLSSEILIHEKYNYNFSGNAVINNKNPKLLVNTAHGIDLSNKPIIKKCTIAYNN